MSKKIQVVLPEKLAKDIEEIIKQEGHESLSEFARYTMQEYVVRAKYGLLKAPGGI